MSNRSRTIPSQEGDIVRMTEQDPVNITVYGNPVLDVIVNVGEGAGHIVDRDAIEQLATIRPNGTLEFKEGTYVCFYLGVEPILWGPFNPGGRQEAYPAGAKYSIPLQSGEAAFKIIDSNPASVAVVPGPSLRLGGGGANVLFGFYDVFAQLKVELIATVEKTPHGKRGLLDPFVMPLIKKIGPYTKIPLYQQPGINLSIEGLGLKRDRTIFTAEIPGDEEALEGIPAPRGKAIMVNTLYSPQVALDAFAYACANDHLGILALTKSLCSKRALDRSIVDRFLARHPHMALHGHDDLKSVHDFVTKVVLAKGRCTLIMNEAEIEHLTGVTVGIYHGDNYLPTLGGIVEALNKVRDFQQSIRERIYVTLGADGAMGLTEHDKLIYCGIVEDRSRMSTGKTAIGDTYATFILALETIGNYIRSHNIPAQDVSKAAAAGADSGVYDGFGNLAVYKVNRFLGDGNRRLLDLGTLSSFPHDKWKAMGISDMRDSDWDSLSRGNHMQPDSSTIFVPGTLQEVIGRAFLRV